MQLVIYHGTGGLNDTLEVKEFTDQTQKQGSSVYRKCEDGEFYHRASFSY